MLARNVSRSNMYVLLLDLLDEGAITMDDLSEFSDDLKEAVRKFRPGGEIKRINGLDFLYRWYFQ